MATLQEFSKNFDGKAVPEALSQLLEFQEEAGFECYAQGFGLLCDDKSGLKNGWSNDPAFLGKLMPFAQANSGGSFYALWQYENTVGLHRLPVVIFGDEGGEYIVAENIKGLLQLLTLDVEPIVYEKVSYYKGAGQEPSDYAKNFRKWLKMRFNLDPIEKAEQIVAPAQEKYQATFDAWKQQYFG
ncbi:hypothetical protein [Longitalea luteola]|uniref:hypothetical protein n=1 Tax=Longitalea luteola TaxID=2812563 RepID=UPI001A95BF3F|nr:hypothetical protein [Longitalea luteola]